MTHTNLLKKYINYVVVVEGVDFILEEESAYSAKEMFTDVEWQELTQLAKQARAGDIVEPTPVEDIKVSFANA